MIEPTGYTALDLVGYTDKGTYATNVNYVKNDLVHYGGSIWRILIDDTIGITPAEGPNYTLFIGEPTNLVERIIAPLEDNPATVAYTTGRQIIYNDYLYEVIQNIAVGDILIAYEDDPTNANIKLASPVETQVLALKADKVNKSDIANNVTTTTEGKVLDARQGKALQDGKTDNSVIAPVENNATASRAYAAGAHFIKNGAFCTAKTAIAQGETFTLNTNYTAGNIASSLDELHQDIRVTNVVNATDRDSIITNVSSVITIFPKLRIALCDITFANSAAVGSTGAIIGNWEPDYIPYGSRPIVPLVADATGEVDGSMYTNNQKNINTKLKVYSLNRIGNHMAQFVFVLK